jgi:hypothetical protein
MAGRRRLPWLARWQDGAAKGHIGEKKRNNKEEKGRPRTQGEEKPVQGKEEPIKVNCQVVPVA